MKVYLGIDVGSVSTKAAVIDAANRVIASVYIATQGRPIPAVQEVLRRIAASLADDCEIAGAGTTGSGRRLAGVMAGGDIVKNEITAHAVAAINLVPDVRTVLEIGGQDSKIIIIRDGIVTDFAMNTVCAAGTGSFLDRQAARLNLPIEKFGQLAVGAKSPVRIAGRCAVFAESDMIHKQQVGHETADIIGGLCEALVRNYLSNVGKGKEILPKVVFQGGVAANAGIKAAFERTLATEVVVPPYYDVMGAVGAALLARSAVRKTGKTQFRGFGVTEASFRSGSFECGGCENQCEVIEIKMGEEILARWGDRCGKWQNLPAMIRAGA